MPWRIKATRLPKYSNASPSLLATFSVGDPNGEAGYSTGLPLPLPRSFVFTANAGSEIDEYPESDLSGITDGRVVELKVEMNDASVFTVEPTLAPRPFRRRFHWLRGVRFFDLFFSEAQEPQRVTALDPSGRVLGRGNRKRGFSSF